MKCRLPDQSHILDADFQSSAQLRSYSGSVRTSRSSLFGVSTGGCFPSFYQWLQVIISPSQPASLTYWAHWRRSSASCCFWSLALEQKSHKIRLIMNFSLVTIGLFWEFCHHGEESRTGCSQGNPEIMCLWLLCAIIQHHNSGTERKNVTVFHM